MVTLENIVYTLSHGGGQVEILRGISLHLPRGCAAGLVGASGSGKSSLLSLIAGVERPTSGMLQVAGQDLTRLTEDQLARFRLGRVGIVFQEFHLIPTLTAMENVALPLILAKEKEVEGRARQLLTQVGLGHRLDHRPAELSGGERQRTALARAFITQPPLILADEPTGNLDPVTGEHIISLLFDMASHWQATLLLVTHDPALARRVDRLWRLVDGRLEAEG